MAKKPVRIDVYTRAVFHEQARRIVARRNSGLMNTIADIECVLKDAYCSGYSAALMKDEKKNNQISQDFVDWIEIPSRSRNTLQFITYGCDWRDGRFVFDEDKFQSSKIILRRIAIDGKTRWVDETKLGSGLID